MRSQSRRLIAVTSAVAACLLWSTCALATIYATDVTLNGTKEVPSNGSTATGAAHVLINTDANTVSYHLEHNVVNQTAAHIHGFAGVGVNAGIQHTIANGPVVNGTWNYSEADEANILAGNTYINVHSNAFPGGEIRGQINSLAVSSPSFNMWGAVLLSLALLAAGAFVVRRRRAIA